MHTVVNLFAVLYIQASIITTTPSSSAILISYTQLQRFFKTEELMWRPSPEDPQGKRAV